MDMKIVVVFCSPAGSTRHVAEVVQSAFAQKNVDVEMITLGKSYDTAHVMQTLGPGRTCLFVGSPVYRDVVVPPVRRFMEALTEGEGSFAVPFITWGAACSGVALWQMGKDLSEKGFGIAGAAKICAEHSLMWNVEDPAGKGHPDKDDDSRIEGLVSELLTRFDSDRIPVLDLDQLDYQPHDPANEMKQKLDEPWMIVPKHVNEEACTQCGICREECPAAAIALNPYPEFTSDCFDCFNCIRLCPEDAIVPETQMNQLEDRIRNRVKKINERPLTQIFLP